MNFNYFMVGVDLYFFGCIEEVCDVIEEEVEYGYVYGKGGVEY